MPDDRLQLPDSLEKALDYAKQQPTDWELAKKRAQMWEQVSAKGRLLQRWSRWWKPLTGVVATAAVVLAAVLVSSHLPNGKGTNNWGTASSPKSPNGQSHVIQPAFNDNRELVSLYKQQGQQFIYHDLISGYDLVLSQKETANTHEFALARNGIIHPILAIPNDKKVLPLGTYGTRQWIGFTLEENTPYNTGLPTGTIYLIDPDSFKVVSIPTDSDKGYISRIAVWDGNSSQLTVYFAQLDSNTEEEQVYKWEGAASGVGNTKALFSMKGDVLHMILTFTAKPVLLYSHYLYQVEDDGNVRLIDSASDLSMKPVDGLNQKALNGLLYEVGSFPEPSFSLYTGDQRVKLYSYATETSQLLLPDVQGDQGYVSNVGNNKFLLQSFVADDPAKAQQMKLQQVPGTFQLWFVQLGQAPKLVYKQHEVGEMLYPLSSVTTSGVSGYHTHIEEYTTSSKATNALDFDWETQTVKQISLNGSK